MEDLSLTEKVIQEKVKPIIEFRSMKLIFFSINFYLEFAILFFPSKTIKERRKTLIERYVPTIDL
jgi:hypothetical protein